MESVREERARRRSWVRGTKRWNVRQVSGVKDVLKTDIASRAVREYESLIRADQWERRT